MVEKYDRGHMRELRVRGPSLAASQELRARQEHHEEGEEEHKKERRIVH